jgi:acetyltransferase-like isoleucine patch superfamily enzyme
VELARKKGVKVGEGCEFITMPDFSSEPYFITIGNNVKISFDVTFLTHDGGRWLLEKMEGIVCPKFGKISVGDNTFIGCKVIIMPNVSIGKNCVIGAGSIVTKNVPDGEVWAGNPARFIKKTIEYNEQIKRLNDTQEHKDLVAYEKNIKGEQAKN